MFKGEMRGSSARHRGTMGSKWCHNAAKDVLTFEW